MATRAEPAAATRYFAALYSPPQPRRALEQLTGIELEIAAALRPGLEHHIAHVRLAWWREECERTRRGAPVHPLTRGLLAELGGLEVDLSGLVDTAVWDLAAATFATRTELAGYCERWARSLTELAAASAAQSAVERQALARAGRTLGVALRELQMLAELAQDARAGRLRVPLDELERAGVEPESLARDPWPPALCVLLRSRSTVLRAELTAAATQLPPEAQSRLRGLLAWAALALRQARLTEQALPRQVRIGRAQRLSDAWLAWRAARRAARGCFAI